MNLNNRSKKLRRDVLTLGTANGFYHYGGSFSCAEILIALYDNVMTEDDLVILSKGHSWLTQVVLLREKGFNPTLCGHPQLDEANGIYATTGSLGHGLPIAIGRAKAKKMLKQAGCIFCIIGDGEAQEGTLWEGLLVAAHHELNNLCIILDQNGIQGSGRVHDILSISSVALFNFLKAAQWNVDTVNGHDMASLTKTLISSGVNGIQGLTTRPTFIFAQTVKGAGVSFMENDPSWHARFPNPEELQRAYVELTS